MGRPHLEVADVFRACLPAYIEKFEGKIPPEHWKVINAITNCRTAALGGHVDQCSNCAHQLISYNSCRNRHCPKCQSLAKAKWLKARSAKLLPVTYYHVVFTIPHQLCPLGLQNKKVFYNNLFQSASRTMQTIAADPGIPGQSPMPPRKLLKM